MFFQALSEDVASQKAKARDIISSGKKLLREHTLEEEPQIRDKLDNLRHVSDHVAKMSTERQSLLEQALPLATHFQETHVELVGWLREIEPALNDLYFTPINPDQVKKQQETIKVIMQILILFVQDKIFCVSIMSGNFYFLYHDCLYLAEYVKALLQNVHCY